MSTTQKSSSFTTTAKNVGFRQATETFTNAGWHLVENETDRVTFKRQNDVYDEFKMRARETHIEVVIPMPNSQVAYCTRFSNYYEASEYIVSRFHDYLDASEEKEQNAEN
jgi:hypothetical protein